MGLTVNRKTAKNLDVRPKNERSLTVSSKKMLIGKKYNHKIRSRDLLLNLMCYAFLSFGSENYNRNRKLSVESVCIICPMDVIARVDRRFDSSTILRLSTFFHADWLRWLYCAQWRREAYRKI